MYRSWLTQTYGTTAAERAFWAQALPELALALPAHQALVQRCLQPAQILQVSEAGVALGFAYEALAKPLTHPGLKKQIEQTLSAVARRTVQVRYAVIPDAP